MIIKKIFFFLLFSIIGNVLAADPVIPEQHAEPYSCPNCSSLDEIEKEPEVEFKQEDFFPELTVIIGPMGSGKTTAVIAKANESLQREEKIVVFRPSVSINNNEDFTYSDGQAEGLVKSIAVGKEGEMLNFLKWDTGLVCIDDVQFFSPEIVGVVKKILSIGFEVAIAGYDFDYRMEPFGSTLQLARLARRVVELKAKCKQCGNSACFSQKVVSDDITIGDHGRQTISHNENFEPCCAECYDITNCLG